MIFRFGDVQEAVEALPGLELEYRQLGSGGQDILFEMYGAEDASFTRIQTRTEVEGFGDIVPGRVCCVVFLGGEKPHLYDGHSVQPGQLYVRSGSHDGAHQILRRNYRAWIVDLPHELVQANLNADPGNVWGSRSVIELSPDRATLLNRFLEGVGQNLSAGQIDGKRATDLLVSLLCQTLPDKPHRRLSSRERYSLARKAQELMHEHAALTVTDICRHLFLSESTLRRLFRDFFGVSPAHYNALLRLNRVRTELKVHPFQKGIVSSVATRHGFWHMGRFGAHYKRLFGESPTATLKK